MDSLDALTEDHVGHHFWEYLQGDLPHVFFMELKDCERGGGHPGKVRGGRCRAGKRTSRGPAVWSRSRAFPRSIRRWSCWSVIFFGVLIEEEEEQKEKAGTVNITICPS